MEMFRVKRWIISALKNDQRYLLLRIINVGGDPSLHKHVQVRSCAAVAWHELCLLGGQPLSCAEWQSAQRKMHGGTVAKCSVQSAMCKVQCAVCYSIKLV